MSLDQIVEKLEQEFECTHPRTEIRYVLQSNGVKMYKRQCLHCGQGTTSAIAHTNVPDRSSVPPFDNDLRDSFWQQRNTRRRELLDDGWQARREKYYEYLESPQWKEKRRAVLQRDNYVCQACLHRRASQAHHLTYEHIYNEPLFELVAVCSTCHEKLHAPPSSIVGYTNA